MKSIQVELKGVDKIHSKINEALKRVQITRVFNLLTKHGYNSIDFMDTGIRVAYWNQLPDAILKAICKIIPVKEESDFDDETGWHYFYKYQIK
jgi:hypothetical protein